MMKSLLIVTAVIETATGIALVLAPPLVVSVLLGASLDTSAAVALGRVAGAALLSLGIACWFARHDGQSRAATGLVTAMLLYNLAVVAVLTFAGLGSGLIGIALWPAVVLHTALAVWCIACLRITGVNMSGGAS